MKLVSISLFLASAAQATGQLVRSGAQRPHDVVVKTDESNVPSEMEELASIPGVQYVERKHVMRALRSDATGIRGGERRRLQATQNPTVSPTQNPTSNPTNHPTSDPTASPTRNPTSEPTDQPTSDPTGSPTDHPTGTPTGPTCSPSEGTPVEVEIQADEYGGEISWTLTNECTGAVVASKPRFTYSKDELRIDSYCVPPGSYKFVIEDSQKDGLCCLYGLGSYEVRMKGYAKASGEAFGSYQSTSWGDCRGVPTPSPTPNPTTPSPTAQPTSSPTLKPTPVILLPWIEEPEEP